MSGKRIFILNGHPAEVSLNRAMAEIYAASAQSAGHTVKIMHLQEMTFDIDHGFNGYRHIKPLEPVLERVLEAIRWSDHVVVVSPMWWGGLPAKLKGLIDLVFQPGQTFDTRHLDWKGMPKPLLTGRSARLIMTSDTPGWFLRLMYGNAIVYQFRHQIMGFVGITPTRVSYFAPASHPKPGAVDK